ncbi:MAG: hypothetical protein U1A27_10215 [Phycisphaerae bacterium]
MRKVPGLLFGLWTAIAAPAACTAGVLEHPCDCGKQADCSHESECGNDPCASIVAPRAGSTTTANDITASSLFSDAAFISQFSTQLSGVTPLLPAEVFVLLWPDEPFPAVELPLLI